MKSNKAIHIFTKSIIFLFLTLKEKHTDARSENTFSSLSFHFLFYLSAYKQMIWIKRPKNTGSKLVILVLQEKREKNDKFIILILLELY